jgi:hypothetical protein
MPIPAPSESFTPEARAARLGAGFAAFGPTLWFLLLVGGYALATHGCSNSLRKLLPWCSAVSIVLSALCFAACLRGFRRPSFAGVELQHAMRFVLASGLMLNGYSVLLSIGLLIVSSAVAGCE